nr:MAG TPA: hypothetical protein [Caudoviricetes sp.]DAJ29661.1 MAG TPA: hypothetical protein [Caudoviricetes sp.]
MDAKMAQGCWINHEQSRVRTHNFITPPSGGFFICGI